MPEAAQQDGRPNVFISYSRDDLAFADQLRAALLAYDFAVTIDRESITSGEDWKKRLGVLIRDADTIVFVLSPSSARSPVCTWVATEAVSLGKRVIPVLCRALDRVAPPPELVALQYTYFYDEPKSPGSGFGTGLNTLRMALNADPGWLREHTRYLRLAKEWEEVGKPSDRRLLSAADIALATAWVGSRPAKAPEVTALELEFINASQAADIRQKSAETQRQREISEAQTGAEKRLSGRRKHRNVKLRRRSVRPSRRNESRDGPASDLRPQWCWR
jgi:TIR domain